MPQEDRDAELRIFQEQAAADGKPEQVQEKIAEGRMRKWLEEVVLLKQQKMPLVVFNLKTPGNIARVIRGEPVGTKIVPGDG